MQIDPVEQWSGNSASIKGYLVWCAAALPIGVAQIATVAGVHRCDQLEARGKIHLARGARDGDASVLERLAQHLQHAPFELLLGSSSRKRTLWWAIENLARPGRCARGDKLFGKPKTNSVVEALGPGPVATGGLTIAARQQAASILAALTNFGNSASPAVAVEHVSLTGRMARLPEDAAAALVDHVRRLAIALGARMTNPNDAFPLGQTGYMKVWSLRRQRIHADFLAVDETQDSNSALVHVLGSADDADRVLRRQQPAAVCVARGAIDAIGSPSRPAHDLAKHERPPGSAGEAVEV